jgi:hypothetical protein
MTNLGKLNPTHPNRSVNFMVKNAVKSMRSETAELKDNDQITITFFSENERGCSHGDATLSPEDANYMPCKDRFGLAKAGDAKTIDSEWQDGQWVDLSSN